MDAITINDTTQSPEDWEGALSKAVDTGWFDCIVRHLEGAGTQVKHKLAKRKACHVRMAITSVFCYGLISECYQEDFGEKMPLLLDGKNYRDFL